MTTLLLHLSDLHIASKADPILSRAQAIANAVRNLDYDVTRVVVAFSGDIAFSGTEGQYVLAGEFLSDLVDELSRKGVPDVQVVMAPGNHDCDFSHSGFLRRMCVDQVIADPSASSDPEVIALCTSVQAEFLAFAKDAGEDRTVEGALGWQHVLVPDRLVVSCFNSAWLSQKNEDQGHLLLSPDALPPTEKGTVKIAVFHHPYGWLKADNAQEVRRVIEANFDIVLTGHEHASTRRRVLQGDTVELSYIEGAALQSPGEEPCWRTRWIDEEIRAERQERIQAHLAHWNGG